MNTTEIVVVDAVVVAVAVAIAAAAGVAAVASPDTHAQVSAQETEMLTAVAASPQIGIHHNRPHGALGLCFHYIRLPLNRFHYRIRHWNTRWDNRFCRSYQIAGSEV